MCGCDCYIFTGTVMLSGCLCWTPERFWMMHLQFQEEVEFIYKSWVISSIATYWYILQFRPVYSLGFRFSLWSFFGNNSWLMCTPHSINSSMLINGKFLGSQNTYTLKIRATRHVCVPPIIIFSLEMQYLARPVSCRFLWLFHQLESWWLPKGLLMFMDTLFKWDFCDAN